MLNRLFHVVGVVGVLSACQSAAAQDQQPTERERELERQVRELLVRMDELERRLEAQEGSQPPGQGQPTQSRRAGTQPPGQEQPPAPATQPGVEERLSKLEKRLFKYPDPLDVYWQEGIRFASPDGEFKLKLGGRLQLDGGIMDADNGLERGGFSLFDRGTGDLEDAVEFRRALLYVEGQLYENSLFKVEYDFAGGDASFKDVYFGLKNLPWVGNIRAGHFKEPFSLEQLTSSKYITFMERSLGNEALVPARNTGVMLHNTAFDERMTWQAGGFVRTDDFGDGEFNQGFDSTGRLTGLLWYEDEGAELLHLGAAVSHQNYEGDRDLDEHLVRFRSRPESHLAPRFIDTGNFYAESSNLFGLESAWVHGPLSVQSEYMRAFIDGVGCVFGHTPNPQFQAFYIMTSYFLTGEHRAYNRSMGAFDRVKPNKNYGKDGGWGAWEVAARYSMVDLDDDSIRGGEEDNFTFGLNWYLNPNMKMMFNYIFADPEDAGDANLFMARMQIDF